MIEIDLIKKHGKKALGMSEHGHQQQTWRQRLPEILLEIGIIVFAVTLSIQLHAWHEHSLDREAERKFLLGLRTDLEKDLAEMVKDSATYALISKVVLNAQQTSRPNQQKKNKALPDSTRSRKPEAGILLRRPVRTQYFALRSHQILGSPHHH